MSENLIRQLKSLKHGAATPKAEWVKNNRAQLLSQIKNTIPEKVEFSRSEKMWQAVGIFFPRLMVNSLVRPMAAILVVAVITSSVYSGAAKASSDSLPGEWLYPTKRAAEKTQEVVLNMVGSKSSQTKLHVEFAKRRVSEVKKMLASNDPTKVAKVSDTVADLKNEIKVIDNKLQEVNKDLTAGDVKDIKQGNEQLKNDLQDAKTTLLISTSTENKIVAKEVTEAKDMVKNMDLTAVQTIVDKHLDGDTTVTKEEVKQVITDALQTSATDVAASKQTVQGVSTVLDSMKVEAKDVAAEAKKQGSETVSGTQQVVEKITLVADAAKEAVKQTGVVTAGMDKKLTEAQTLLASDDLFKTANKLMDAVKETNQISKEAEKISDNTVASTQNMLAVVPVPVVVVAGTSSPAVDANLLGAPAVNILKDDAATNTAKTGTTASSTATGVALPVVTVVVTVNSTTAPVVNIIKAVVPVVPAVPAVGEAKSIKK